jgi:hypothetical protein
MGAASSSNAVKAVTNVTNSVTNATTANTNQVSRMKNSDVFSNCNIVLSGNLTIDQTASLSQVSKQIASASSNTSFNNLISQTILQEASSTVGSMGIGYASASNSASVFANSSNAISNDLSVSANQFGDTSNSFLCSNSTIIAKNLDINQSISSNFLSDQTLKQDNTSEIVNDISQSVTQKASAKVEGLVGFLIALAVLIGVIGYSLVRVTASPIILIPILIIVITIVGTGMFLRKTPPFFSDPSICNPSSLGSCKDSNCGDLKENTIKIAEAPLRYIYPISQEGYNNKNGNLLDICVISIGRELDQKPSNNGYTTKVMNYFNDKYRSKLDDLRKKCKADIVPALLYNPYKNEGVYLIPDEYRTDGGNPTSSMCTPKHLQFSTNSDNPINGCPLVTGEQYLNTGTKDEEGIANLNTEEWDTYLQKTNNSQFARFLLLYIINKNLDTSIYIDENEIIGCVNSKGQRVFDIASNVKPNQKYKFLPNNPIDNFNDGISKGGIVTGSFGICQDNAYKLNKFMKTIGIWIIIGIIFVTIIFIIRSRKKIS